VDPRAGLERFDKTRLKKMLKGPSHIHITFSKTCFCVIGPPTFNVFTFREAFIGICCFSNVCSALKTYVPLHTSRF
jgi:hypothetical protein